MSQYRVAVLRGGPSEEYDVSLRTGEALLGALPQDLVTPIDIVITRAGEWLYDGRRYMPERVLDMVDAVIIGLHGAYGEDGNVQRLLERRGIPFTGSGSYASAIAMHKGITKDHLRERGIMLAPHMLVSQSSRGQTYEMARGIQGLFGPEYVIKPVRSGSSHGVVMVPNAAMLPKALDDVLAVYDQVIVEKRIRGKEATCGVIEDFRGEALYALPPVEIVPASSQVFFDYDAKYNGASQEICPGRFSAQEKEELMRLTRLVHDALGLRHYSRSDFIIGEDGIYFLEVNSLPGLTEASLMPRALSAVGSSLQDFVGHLVRQITV